MGRSDHRRVWTGHLHSVQGSPERQKYIHLHSPSGYLMPDAVGFQRKFGCHTSHLVYSPVGSLVYPWSFKCPGLQHFFFLLLISREMVAEGSSHKVLQHSCCCGPWLCGRLTHVGNFTTEGLHAVEDHWSLRPVRRARLIT